jgi:hypothetical protein
VQWLVPFLASLHDSLWPAFSGAGTGQGPLCAVDDPTLATQLGIPDCQATATANSTAFPQRQRNGPEAWRSTTAVKDCGIKGVTYDRAMMHPRPRTPAPLRPATKRRHRHRHRHRHHVGTAWYGTNYDRTTEGRSDHPRSSIPKNWPPCPSRLPGPRRLPLHRRACLPFRITADASNGPARGCRPCLGVLKSK